MEQAAQANSVRRAFDKLAIEGERMARDVDIWISRMGDGEKVLGICLFAMVLLYLIVRRPKTYKEGGGMTRQFVLALGIVVIFSFGVTWMFDGRFEVPSVF